MAIERLRVCAVECGKRSFLEASARNTMGRREHKALAERAGDLRQCDRPLVAVAPALVASEVGTGRRRRDAGVDPTVEHVDEGFHKTAEIERLRHQVRQRSLSRIEVTDTAD